MSERARTSGFGHVEQLASGRWRARYTGPDGQRRSNTFGTKTDARRWLATAQADLVRRAWKAPEAGRRLSEAWSAVAVADVTPQRVRQWHEAGARTAQPTALVQSYRLLRALMNVAVADEVITSNPCRLRAAGIAKSARPSRSLTVDEVQALSEKVPARYRALVLTLAFGGLRFGEATALRRRDVSADGGLVSVERSVRRVSGSWLVGPPTTAAGVRKVALPAFVAATVVAHLETHVGDDPGALIFGTGSGNFLAGSNFHGIFRRAVSACGLDPVRVHELRHTGATLAAATGASTKDLMHRLGHSSSAAALIYQHASNARDTEIARALDALVTDPSVVAMRPRARARPAD